MYFNETWATELKLCSIEGFFGVFIIRKVLGRSMQKLSLTHCPAFLPLILSLHFLTLQIERDEV